MSTSTSTSPTTERPVSTLRGSGPYKPAIDASGDGVTTRLHGAPARVAGLLRISYGLTFLWAFVDKLFGWHFATPSGSGWVSGGNPTQGFLTGSAKGPFAGFYKAIAGAGWTNWLFMLALVGIGLALTLGIGMRLAGAAGVLLYLMMWSVTLPPVTNPVLDDHILGAIALALLVLLGAGHTWGLANRWERLGIVERFPVLR